MFNSHIDNEEVILEAEGQGIRSITIRIKSGVGVIESINTIDTQSDISHLIQYRTGQHESNRQALAEIAARLRETTDYVEHGCYLDRHRAFSGIAV